MLVIGIPSRNGIITIDFAMQLQALRMHYINGIAYAVAIGMPVADARNGIVKTALINKADYVMFIDDDTMIPDNAIAALLQADRDIITGVVYSKEEDEYLRSPMVFKAGQPFTTSDGKVHEIDSCGSACILIKARVFSELAEKGYDGKWYTFFNETKVESTLDSNGKEMNTPNVINKGEDINFCDLAKANGFKIHVHTGIQCGHLDIEKMRVYSKIGVEDISKRMNNYNVDHLKQKVN